MSAAYFYGDEDMARLLKENGANSCTRVFTKAPTKVLGGCLVNQKGECIINDERKEMIARYATQNVEKIYRMCGYGVMFACHEQQRTMLQMPMTILHESCQNIKPQKWKFCSFDIWKDKDTGRCTKNTKKVLTEELKKLKGTEELEALRLREQISEYNLVSDR